MRSISISRGRGFDRGSDKEFAHLLVIARATVSEVKSQLYVALDRGYIKDSEFRTTYDNVTGVIGLRTSDSGLRTSDIGHEISK